MLEFPEKAPLYCSTTLVPEGQQPAILITPGPKDGVSCWQQTVSLPKVPTPTKPWAGAEEAPNERLLPAVPIPGAGVLCPKLGVDVPSGNRQKSCRDRAGVGPIPQHPVLRKVVSVTPPCITAAGGVGLSG